MFNLTHLGNHGCRFQKCPVRGNHHRCILEKWSPQNSFESSCPKGPKHVPCVFFVILVILKAGR